MSPIDGCVNKYWQTLNTFTLFEHRMLFCLPLIRNACGSTVGVSGIVIKRNFGNGNVSGLRPNQQYDLLHLHENQGRLLREKEMD